GKLGTFRRQDPARAALDRGGLHLDHDVPITDAYNAQDRHVALPPSRFIMDGAKRFPAILTPERILYSSAGSFQRYWWRTLGSCPGSGVGCAVKSPVGDSPC